MRLEPRIGSWLDPSHWMADLPQWRLMEEEQLARRPRVFCWSVCPRIVDNLPPQTP